MQGAGVSTSMFISFIPGTIILNSRPTVLADLVIYYNMDLTREGQVIFSYLASALLWNISFIFIRT